MTNNEAIAAGAAVEANAETPAHLKNDKRHADLMRQITKLGEEASLGKDSLPKLAHAVVKGAADGVFDTDTKDAKGNDLATQIYEKYAAAEGKKAIHEHSAGGKKANISKLRQLIAMGCMTTIDAVEVMQAAFEARKAMIADDNKVKSAYPYYVDVARKQLESKTPLTKRELENLALKDGPKEKSLEGELTRVMKVLEGLVTGENRDGLKDTDALTEAAFQAVRERVAKLQMATKRAELVKAAAALGMKLA